MLLSLYVCAVCGSDFSAKSSRGCSGYMITRVARVRFTMSWRFFACDAHDCYSSLRPHRSSVSDAPAAFPRLPCTSPEFWRWFHCRMKVPRFVPSATGRGTKIWYRHERRGFQKREQNRCLGGEVLTLILLLCGRVAISPTGRSSIFSILSFGK